MSGFTAQTTQPHNLEAEQALLGAILVNSREVLLRVRPILPSGGAFYEPVHGRIYDACCQLEDRGQVADPVKLKPYFEADASLQDVGGAAYLVRLAASATTIINAKEYAETIRDLYIRRAAMGWSQDIADRAEQMAVDDNIDDLIGMMSEAANELHDARHAGAYKNLMIAQACEEAMASIDFACEHRGELIGVPTGIDELDEMIGGFQEEQFVVIAARPKMGKTLLATNCARAAAQAGRGVGIFSLEMSRKQLATRMQSDMASLQLHRGIAYQRAMNGRISEDERQVLRMAAEHLSKLPIRIDDTKNISADEIRMSIMRMQREWANTGHPLGVVFVDYLGLIRPGARYRGNKNGEIGEITRMLKVTAGETGIPIVVLSQLNRALENRDNKRPMLSDLRDSGSIEQDADVVLFCYREAEYKRKELDSLHETDRDYETTVNALADLEGKLEIICGAQRNGPTGTVHCHVDLAAGAIRSRSKPDIHHQGDFLRG